MNFYNFVIQSKKLNMNLKEKRIQMKFKLKTLKKIKNKKSLYLLKLTSLTMEMVYLRKDKANCLKILGSCRKIHHKIKEVLDLVSLFVNKSLKIWEEV